ncbi:MAG: hypothetical protein LUQ26_05305 [Methylococcaceae bacterium]|nr:hypothetical protein [Methylococcaceae bacterium]
MVNKKLVACLVDIIGASASTKGNEFDATVRDKLKKHLKLVSYIPTDRWASKAKTSIFSVHSKRTQSKWFDFSDLPPIYDNGVRLDLMIVNQPNGSQQWPDLLVIYKGIGLPIEVKSAKPDKIVWNGGLPRQNGVYIFNCYGESKVTCFLGKHIISLERRQNLLMLAKVASTLNTSNGEEGEEDGWTYYVRNMYNSNRSYVFNSNIRAMLENDTLAYIENLTWDHNQVTDFRDN